MNFVINTMDTSIKHLNLIFDEINAGRFEKINITSISQDEDGVSIQTTLDIKNGDIDVTVKMPTIYVLTNSKVCTREKLAENFNSLSKLLSGNREEYKSYLSMLEDVAFDHASDL